MSEADALWRYWFETLPREAWFGSDPTVDAELRRRFADLPDRALRGDLDAWRSTARGWLALVLALDQLPRNLYRGSARAFAYDDRARAEADAALRAGVDAGLGIHERLFLYLPFEHSEDLADQDRCCRLVAALDDATYTDFAKRHRDVIRRFGRFPHRNAVLGRTSTPAETAYLNEPDAGF